MSVKELEKVTRSYFKDWMKQVMTVKDGVVVLKRNTSERGGW
jgi:hypothetical protein